MIGRRDFLAAMGAGAAWSIAQDAIAADEVEIPRLHDIQSGEDVFGYVNDVATAKAINAISGERCAGSPEAQRAAGYVLGWHDVTAQQAWDGVAAAWDRLAERRRFWED